MSKRSLNKTLLIGCLGIDPKLRYTPNDGTAVATRKQRTEWHRVVCFGRLAEIVSQYLRKGSYVFRGADADPAIHRPGQHRAHMRMLNFRNGNSGAEEELEEPVEVSLSIQTLQSNPQE